MNTGKKAHSLARYIDFKIVDERAREFPQLRNGYGTDAGHDLFCIHNLRLDPGKFGEVRTGVAVCIPDGYYGRIVARSSAFRKHRFLVLEGIIDAGYTGELIVGVVNGGQNSSMVEKGMSLAQLIIQPVPVFTFQEVIELPQTARGTNGYGSTGTKA